MSFYAIVLLHAVRSAIAATAERLVLVNESLPITGDVIHYNDVVNEPLQACDNQNAEAAPLLNSVVAGGKHSALVLWPRMAAELYMGSQMTKLSMRL